MLPTASKNYEPSAAFSGKSKVSGSSLAGYEDFVKAQQIKLNPKSITSDQL